MEIFNLEKAIREWRKGLFKDPGLEESSIIELEEGLREEIEELVEGGISEEEAFRHVTKSVDHGHHSWHELKISGCVQEFHKCMHAERQCELRSSLLKRKKGFYKISRTDGKDQSFEK